MVLRLIWQIKVLCNVDWQLPHFIQKNSYLPQSKVCSNDICLLCTKISYKQLKESVNSVLDLDLDDT